MIGSRQVEACSNSTATLLMRQHYMAHEAENRSAWSGMVQKVTWSQRRSRRAAQCRHVRRRRRCRQLAPMSLNITALPTLPLPLRRRRRHSLAASRRGDFSEFCRELRRTSLRRRCCDTERGHRDQPRPDDAVESPCHLPCTSFAIYNKTDGKSFRRSGSSHEHQTKAAALGLGVRGA